MDFLTKWLLRHTDVEVRMRGYRNGDERGYIVKMIGDNGYDKMTTIKSYSLDYATVIFDNMYREIIANGGSI
jgi:hypothetical protein